MMTPHRDFDEQARRLVFGEDLRDDIAEDAVVSSRMFTRSQDHLSPWIAEATGRQLSAFEALDSFGFDKLLEAVETGAAVLPQSVSEPAETLRLQRESLGLTIESLGKITNLPVEKILDAESSDTVTSIHILEKLAVSLGLDERLLSFTPGANGDRKLALRLKTLGEEPKFTSRVVATLAECAWVLSTQKRLDFSLSIQCDSTASFLPNENYGGLGYPPWRRGYRLADQTREILGLGEFSPIASLRSLCNTIGIPVIQAVLPENFAGATIAVNSQRAIVVNTKGYNENVWVRRATIAHELGHLLWDPIEYLKSLRVDEYDNIHFSQASSLDRVEARANAFAIELLAPTHVVDDIYYERDDPADGLRHVMEWFGISYTAAKLHISNALGQPRMFDSTLVPDVEPTDEWIGRESFAAEYFPIQSTSITRRGTFAGSVVAAQYCGVISEETAMLYLQAKSIEDYRKHVPIILSMYPTYRDVLRELGCVLDDLWQFE